MTATKGRHGGPRPNSGGRRPGAGRKPAIARSVEGEAPVDAGEESAPVVVRRDPPAAEVDPVTVPDGLSFLVRVMNDPAVPIAQRVRAASKLADFQHAKPGELGKKAQRQAAAEQVAGRFSSAAPPKPRLVQNG